MAQDETPITNWLQKAADGDDDAWEHISAWTYKELEQLAARRMRREFGNRSVTLEPAALVNETFLKLLQHPAAFENRRHFFGFVSTVMLRVLIDYQRARRAGKRQVDKVHITLDGIGSSGGKTSIDALALQQAFEQLAELDARKADVARLRTLWGMTMQEIADVLGVSEPTVRRDWRFSRNWLAEALGTP